MMRLGNMRAVLMRCSLVFTLSILLFFVWSGALLGVGEAPVKAEVAALGLEAPPLAEESIIWHEAGLTAYGYLAMAPDLEAASKSFASVENRGDDYISGLVRWTPVRYSVHVYMDTTGFIAAYYRKGEPATVMVDLEESNDGVSSRLKRTLHWAAERAGTLLKSDVKYYHFDYPESRWLTIAIGDAKSPPFEFLIPPGMSVKEAAVAGYAYNASFEFIVGDKWRHRPPMIEDDYDYYADMFIPDDLLEPGQWQSVEIDSKDEWARCGVVFVY